MVFLEDILKMKGIEIDDIPKVSEYQHQRILGAARAISCILNDLGSKGVSWSKAGGHSEPGVRLHTYDWFFVYRLDEDQSPQED